MTFRLRDAEKCVALVDDELGRLIDRVNGDIAKAIMLPPSMFQQRPPSYDDGFSRYSMTPIGYATSAISAGELGTIMIGAIA